MKNATLYLRVVVAGGKHRYAKAVYNSKGEIRSQYALVDNKPEHHPGGVYQLRYVIAGKRVWEPVGTDPSLASVAPQEKNHDLLGVALGRIPSSPPKAQIVEEPPKAERSTSTPLIKDRVAEYLRETREHKSVATLAAYKVTLQRFMKSCKKGHLEDLDRTDLLTFITALKDKGNAPRTVRNRIDFLQTFLHHFGLPSVLKGKDLPKYTDKKVRAYPRTALDAMFACANQEESDLLLFFLCTGGREQEVEFGCWTDLDREAKTFTVTEKLDLGYIPKDGEEGAIQIPAGLVEMLEARRIRYPKTRLIFPLIQKPKKGSTLRSYSRKKKPNLAPVAEDERADGHLPRIIKSLALRAGVNCGHCFNKVGISCATHPVCKHIILHKLRKTFATMHHNNGMPARTIMRFLRHSDLETTLKYIADQEDDETRGIVEGTFASFGPRMGAARTMGDNSGKV
jgi:integrase/recombinase XerD